MTREGLTGSRIRERRMMIGMRQADLARSLGISPSYLNLIEHNRRRIGGKLLLDIARVLEVEPSLLTEGAEAALMSALRDAATSADLSAEDIKRADEFAGRFPGWAGALAAGYRRIAKLERTVETLSDRLAHDPQLAASVHELLSTAAAIRSTASILADERELEAQWRDRFHANLNEDSKRLAESSKALVNYFEVGQGADEAVLSPQEQVEAFLSRNEFHFPDLEDGRQNIDDVLQGAEELRATAAQKLARTILNRMLRDAAVVSTSALTELIERIGQDPVALSRKLEVPLTVILRRMAAQPNITTGLVVCDRSGSILFRKPVDQFVTPRFGSACALWPLFAALGHVGQVLHTPLVQLGRGRTHFDCFAVAEVVEGTGYNAPPLVEATMLLLPNSAPAPEGSLEVGSTCNVCPKEGCAARREPSMLTEGL